MATAQSPPIHIAGPESHRTRRRQKNRSQKPFYRRPLVVVPTVVLLIVLLTGGFVAHRADSLMSSLQTVSTAPAQVTDATFIEGGDPDMPDGPVTIDTAPAQSALIAAPNARFLPAPPDGGFAANVQHLASGIGDVTGGAARVAGVTSGGNGGFTVLLMGVDARPGSPIDIGVRPDVLMLIRFDPASQSCRMLSIPRDTRTNLPGYGQTKINHALMVGGIPYQLMVTEDFIGQPIDHYVLVDFQAFKQVVDAVGGISVTIPEDLEKNGQLQYTHGTYHFNGDEALAYSRFRALPDGDLGRVKRQWTVMSGLADAASGRDLIGDVNTLVPTVKDHIRTDMTMTEMAGIARDYGNNCLSMDANSINMLAGSRVQFEDPMLHQVLYYNVVDEQLVHDDVDVLIHGEDAPSMASGVSGSNRFASISRPGYVIYDEWAVQVRRQGMLASD